MVQFIAIVGTEVKDPKGLNRRPNTFSLLPELLRTSTVPLRPESTLYLSPIEKEVWPRTGNDSDSVESMLPASSRKTSVRSAGEYGDWLVTAMPV
jgi:hypothetical protein